MNQKKNIKHSEELYELVIEATNHGIWDWNVLTNEVYFSSQWKKQLGYQEDELENSFGTWLNLLHPEDREKNIKAIESYLKNPHGKYIIEFRLKHKQGHYIWIHNEAASKKDENGKVIRMFGAHTDITRQKEAERAMKQSEEKYRAVFESATDAFIIVDSTGNILEVNSSACKVYGYSHQEMIGKKATELIHPDYHHKFPQLIQSINERGDYKGETVDIRKDGSAFFTEIYGSSIQFNGRNHVLVIVRDVNEVKEFNNKLSKEKQFTDAIINALPGVFYIFDKSGKYIKWNKAVENLTGYSAEKLATISPLKTIAPEHREKVTAGIQNVFETGSNVMEADLITTEGTVPYLFSGVRMEQNGQPLLLGLGIDISKRKTIEKEREQLLINLNERVKEMTCLYGINELFRNKSETLSAILQKAVNLIPAGWMYPQRTSAEIKFDAIHVKSENFNKSNHFLSAQIETEEGSRGYINVFLDNARMKKNQDLFIREERVLLNQISLNLARIIDNREYENALKESEKKFRNIIKYSPLPKAILNLDMKVEFANESFIDTIGYTPQEIPDMQTWWQVAFPDENYRNKIKAQWNKVMDTAIDADKISDPVEARVTCKNGQKRIFSVIGNKVGQQFLIIFNDLTERIIAEEKMKQLLAEVQRSNKELEQFAYVASHDLQEPLRMVSSYTQLLAKRYKGQLDERADKYIYYAVDGAVRMQNLINDLLEFSRISTRGEKFTKTNTNDVIEAAVNDLTMKIEETNAQIGWKNLPVVNADKAQLKRLFSNLISNAIKFRTPGKNPRIEIAAEPRNGKWLFCIRDNGIGINQKFHDKIFVIFQRLHGTNEYPGTGIGLAICKQIILRHGGEIWFESEEGKGTTFYFTLEKRKTNT